MRNSKDAAIARQWDNPDLQIPLKFAGMYAFTHLLSGIANLDFHRLMENDTIEIIAQFNAIPGDIISDGTSLWVSLPMLTLWDKNLGNTVNKIDIRGDNCF